MRPYEALALVYDEWTAENDYQGWSEYIIKAAGTSAGGNLLDLCCGTGRMTRLLHDAGYQVTGVDSSPGMLYRAAEALPPGTPLIEKDLAVAGGELGVPSGAFDVVVCSFDSMNYFSAESSLSALFTYAATALRPGGTFVFDVNTRTKLQDVFGDSHYGDDLGSFGYVWRNRYEPSSRTCRFLITLYLREGTLFTRSEEVHVQRWYETGELTSLAAGAGFTIRAVTDDYTDSPAGPDTLRETWVLKRGDGV
ncbi:class I SAM-dependent methyltransferase [Nocardiopsis sp. NPDC007018]|uniref:class I SAM-dependent DNA methyltransferase n=1 Tax=Nocardiopsis sp. NPDC007018 TaxID=3155721 RepID=UPI0033F454E5